MYFIEQLLESVLKHPTCADGVRRFRAAHVSSSYAKTVSSFYLLADYAKANNMEIKMDTVNNTVDIAYLRSDGVKAELQVCFIPVNKDSDVHRLQALEISDFINEAHSQWYARVSKTLKVKCRYWPDRS